MEAVALPTTQDIILEPILKEESVVVVNLVLVLEQLLNWLQTTMDVVVQLDWELLPSQLAVHPQLEIKSILIPNTILEASAVHLQEESVAVAHQQLLLQQSLELVWDIIVDGVLHLFLDNRAVGVLHHYQDNKQVDVVLLQYLWVE